jgi:lysozyme
MIESIIDVSHHNGTSLDFVAASNAGIAAVIHKGSQGTSYADPRLTANKTAILAAGLLFGAYHFGDGSDGGQQAQFYLSTVRPQPNELIALDFEGNTAGPSMTLEEARAFVSVIRNSIGKWPVLYAGHYLKDQLGQQPDAVLANCPLWIAQYGPAVVLPPGWNKWSLWQYTDGMVGTPPAVPGIGHCDQERFDETAQTLAAFWASVSV